MAAAATVTAVGAATASVNPGDRRRRPRSSSGSSANSGTDFKELALGPGEAAYIVRDEGIGTATGGDRRRESPHFISPTSSRRRGIADAPTTRGRSRSMPTGTNPNDDAMDRRLRRPLRHRRRRLRAVCPARERGLLRAHRPTGLHGAPIGDERGEPRPVHARDDLRGDQAPDRRSRPTTAAILGKPNWGGSSPGRTSGRASSTSTTCGRPAIPARTTTRLAGTSRPSRPPDTRPPTRGDGRGRAVG